MGGIHLRYENLTRANQIRIDQANSNTKNWPPKSVGISLQIGKISLKQVNTEHLRTQKRENKVQIGGEKVSRTSSGKLARNENMDRTNRRGGIGTTNAGGSNLAKGTSKGMLAVEGLNLAIEGYYSISAQYDQSVVNAQIGDLEQALITVNSASREGLIPAEFSGISSMSQIANVVLQGPDPSYQSNPGKMTATDVGIKILKNYNLLREPNPNGGIPDHTTRQDNTNRVNHD